MENELSRKQPCLEQTLTATSIKFGLFDEEFFFATVAPYMGQGKPSPYSLLDRVVAVP
jgi:hypothetical protein